MSVFWVWELMMEVGLEMSPIFGGMTRPPMMFGVTVDYLFICFIFANSLFMMADNPLFLITFLPLHVFGWVVCKIDSNYFRVIVKKTECPNVPNKPIWGCQSYEPF